MTFYHISEKSNLTQLMPKVPKSLFSDENKTTPRVCFSGSIHGCCIAKPSYKGLVYTVYKATLALLGELGEREDLDNIMIKPNIDDVPDIEFTDEYWFTGLGIEIEPIGTIMIEPTNKVLGEVQDYPVMDYKYVWVEKFNVKQVCA